MLAPVCLLTVSTAVLLKTKYQQMKLTDLVRADRLTRTKKQRLQIYDAIFKHGVPWSLIVRSILAQAGHEEVFILKDGFRLWFNPLFMA